MSTLLVPRSEEEIAGLVAKILSETYGDISVNGTSYTFHGTTPTDEVIAATRDTVIDDFNAATIKDECKRRILVVMKDADTETNILAWWLDLISRDEISGEIPGPSERADIQMVRDLFTWIRAMQEASRALIADNDPTYAENVRWPASPTGAPAFINRF